MTKLEKLNVQIRKCKKCPLWKSATNAVPGEGPATAKIFFLGEAPGAEEDKQGRPFVGMAGRFLDKELKKFSLDRKKIFITGTVKHRPPRNRRPKPKEIVACLPWTKRQFEIIKPRLICLLGDVAVKAMLGKGYSVLKDHGKIVKIGKRVFLIMPHPAAAMRFPKMKKAFERDLKILKRLYPSV